MKSFIFFTLIFFSIPTFATIKVGNKNLVENIKSSTGKDALKILNETFENNFLDKSKNYLLISLNPQPYVSCRIGGNLTSEIDGNVDFLFPLKDYKNKTIALEIPEHSSYQNIVVDCASDYEIDKQEYSYNLIKKTDASVNSVVISLNSVQKEASSRMRNYANSGVKIITFKVSKL